MSIFARGVRLPLRADHPRAGTREQHQQPRQAHEEGEVALI